MLTILTGMVARLVQISGLTPIDRTLGFIFGLARGAFLLCLAYMIVEFVPIGDRPQWIKEAKSSQFLGKGADLLKGFLPESLKVKSAEAASDLMQKVDPAAAAKAEAEKAMRALATPAPPAAPEPAPAPSYRPGDQKQLDRLIGTQR